MNLKFLCSLLLLGLNIAANVAWAAPQPLLRAHLSPGTASVGQVATLEISVLVPGWFVAPPEVPQSLAVTGARVRLMQRPGPNLNETIEGVPFAGIRKTYEVIADRPGKLEIPSFHVVVAFSDGERKRHTVLASPPLLLDATVPAGLEDLGYLIATPRYRLSQTLDRNPRALRVGDAIVRTLEQSAESLAAVQLPVLQAVPIDGIATYPDDAVFDERHGEHGAADLATQTQRITYLLQKPGRYELPALEVRWFDTARQKVEKARLPALALEVAGEPNSAIAATSADEPRASAKPRWTPWAAHWSRMAGISCGAIWLALRLSRRAPRLAGRPQRSSRHARNTGSRFKATGR